MVPAPTRNLLIPPALKPGDRIAIISPATEVKREYVEGAAGRLRSEGFSVEVMPGALGPADGSFAASFDSRLSDLRTALLDPEVRCILCARGGYGCVHLLPHISLAEVRENPKWLIGFSDISALHALWHRAGVASLHAPMAKHLTLLPPDDPATVALLSILRGERPATYHAAPSPFNLPGKGEGVVRGGNLAVLNGLADTPYDILRADEGEDVILFIEDISEAIYAVERMLIRLHLSGVLDRVKGLIIGQFTEYHPDRNYNSMEEMISALLKRCGFAGRPVAFNFPTGHVDYNLPLVEGMRATLEVTGSGATLTPVPDAISRR